MKTLILPYFFFCAIVISIGCKPIPSMLPNMVVVQGGTFQMGSGSTEVYTQPSHSVTLSDFYIGKYEVTQKLWREIVLWKQANGGTSLSESPSSEFKGDSLPVGQVSWYDIQDWLSYLNQREGTTKYRLPTEAEWEYSARGGNRSQGYTYCGSNTLDSVAWHLGNSDYRPHSVGTMKANELGIFDMSGNVDEWVNDWDGPCTTSAQTNPTGPESGVVRMSRGGGWYSSDNGCRIVLRGGGGPDIRFVNVGFRIARNY
ncbi:MAG: SUMF1/EgtB/PvdO family nonheme iron enzyme [bacterium]